MEQFESELVKIERLETSEKGSDKWKIWGNRSAKVANEGPSQPKPLSGRDLLDMQIEFSSIKSVLKPRCIKVLEGRKQ